MQAFNTCTKRTDRTITIFIDMCTQINENQLSTGEIITTLYQNHRHLSCF